MWSWNARTREQSKQVFFDLRVWGGFSHGKKSSCLLRCRLFTHHRHRWRFTELAFCLLCLSRHNIISCVHNVVLCSSFMLLKQSLSRLAVPEIRTRSRSQQRDNQRHNNARRETKEWKFMLKLKQKLFSFFPTLFALLRARSVFSLQRTLLRKLDHMLIADGKKKKQKSRDDSRSRKKN